MAGPRDRSTVLSYGTLILSFAYDYEYEIRDNPCTFHVLCACDHRLAARLASCDLIAAKLRIYDRAVGNP